MNFQELKELTVEHWLNKGLYSVAKNKAQVNKLSEEVAEVGEALESKSVKEQKTEIGDCLTAIINLCEMNGFDPEECLYFAYLKNKNRNGRFINGYYVHTGGE